MKTSLSRMMLLLADMQEEKELARVIGDAKDVRVAEKTISRITHIYNLMLEEQA